MNFVTHGISYSFILWKLTGNILCALIGFLYGSWIDYPMYLVQWRKIFNKEKFDYSGIYNLLHKPELKIKNKFLCNLFYWIVGIFSGFHPQIDRDWHNKETGEHKKGLWKYEILIILFCILLFIFWS